MIQAINSFRLVRDGLGGLVADTMEIVYRGSFASVDTVKGRECKLPVPVDLKGKIGTLKYYFLSLTMHWNPDWTTRYLTEDQAGIIDMESNEKSYIHVLNLWDRTKIIGVKVKGDKFFINGAIEPVDGKVMGMSTVGVTEDDNCDFYNSAMELIGSICEDVIKHLQSDQFSLETAKLYLQDKFDDEDEKNRIEGQDKDLTRQEMIDQLERDGAIIIPSMEMEKKLLSENDGGSVVSENKSDLGSERFTEASEEEHSDFEDTDKDFVEPDDGKETMEV
jgi:hypothetical protein